MLIHIGYAILFLMMLIGLLGALFKMGNALEQSDLDSYSIWTCVATAIAFLPSIVW